MLLYFRNSFITIARMYKFLFFLIFFCLKVKYSMEDGNEENLNKLAVANNELGVKLYHKLTQEDHDDGNIFFSPLSLSTAFGMLFIGTGGNSAKQLRNVLGYKAAQLSSKEVPSAFKQYLNKIANGRNAYVLNLANELLLSNRFDVKPDYIKEVKQQFQATVENVDFTNSKQIVKEANDWVSKETHGKIDKLLTSLSPSTLFLILNAIYFKGTWQTQFNPKYTSDGMFYNHGKKDEGKVVKVMHAYKEKFPFSENEQYKTIELPYKGKDISMIIILPNTRDGLQETEEKFSAEDIKTIQSQLHITTLDLALPKFNLTYSHQMASDFNSLGAKDIYDSNLANFSGITASKGLFVNQVAHKAAIEVNEEGSEAAAGTGIGGAQFVPPSFFANHPFLFIILDKRNSLVLFMGRVTQF